MIDAPLLVYAVGLIVTLIIVCFRRDVAVPCIVLSFLMGLAYFGNVQDAVATVFRGLTQATIAIIDLILLFGVMFALLSAMRDHGSAQLMVSPLERIMTTPTRAFVTLFIASFVLTLFFWATPAAAIILLLLPIAIERAHMPPIHAAAICVLAGHGMGLASDIVL
jgi:di/tricarboxylate transporter